MKCCNNCANSRNCFYKGIINPCDDWIPNMNISNLNMMARNIKDSKMSYEEHRFVDACVHNISFSPKQEQWLRSIYARVLASKTLV